MSTPIILSIKHGHYDAYVLLIEHGAIDESEEALLFAAEYGHTRICELLLDSGYDPMGNYWCDYEGGTALHLAAREGHIDTCKLLIERGADINFADSFATPLHAAASSARVDICKLLLDNGADMYKYGYGFDHRGNPSTNLPIDVAAENGHTDVCKVFIDAGMDLSNNSSALFAMGYKHYETCRFLIRHGASTYGFDEDNYNLEYLNTITPTMKDNTPLIHAIMGGHYNACALLLLDYNADKYKDRPLHTAARYGRIDICELLLSTGIDINYTDDVYGTVLDHTVLSVGNVEMCRFLLSKGADPNKSTGYLDSQLHNAIAHNNLELCKLLIDHGIDIEARNAFGATPLCNAIINGYTDIAKLLITRGANTNVHTIGGQNWSRQEEMLSIATAIISVYSELIVLYNRN
jgi:ankyrin repeat protein